MIGVGTYRLKNGMTLLHHRDATTKMVALNLLYKVGARNERLGHTGLAHLIEHLMFGGSAHIPSFDEALQRAGGESNAWTSNDVTNYYDVLPAQNVETAFWLESDRLLEPVFTSKSIEAQRSVVIEEFKERCLNEPYGDISHIIRANAYKVHPYRWPVIGMSVHEIEAMTVGDVRDFFYRHYTPTNLILCVSGNIERECAIALAEKWFGEIKGRETALDMIPTEPAQEEARLVSVKKDVPQNMIVKAYHMSGRLDDDYQVADIISDILANGNSARFFRNVLMKGDLFCELDATIGGNCDPGLLIVKGRLCDGVSYSAGIKAIDNELQSFLNEGTCKYEIEKYVNKLESKELFENISYLEKATKLCTYEMLGGADGINREMEKYRKIAVEDVSRVSKQIFREDNCTTVLYGKQV